MRSPEEVLILRNKRITLSTFFVYIALSLSFLHDIVKGYREPQFLGMFCLILWIPWILSYIYLKLQDYRCSWYGVVLLYNFLFFYTYALFCTVDDIIWIYMFPLSYISIIFFNQRFATSLIVLYGFVNILDLIIEFFTVDNSIGGYNNKQRVFIIILSILFLRFTCNVVNIYQKQLQNILYTINYDKLTGFYSHEVAERMTQKEITKLGYFTVTSAILIDIDNFSMYRKNYNKDFCDKVILTVTDIVKNVINDTGLLCNVFFYPEDKFLIIVAGKERADLKSIAESICKNVNNMILNYMRQKEVPLSVSIGVTDTNACGVLHFTELYNAVLRATLKAKENGKNNVYIDLRGIKNAM